MVHPYVLVLFYNRFQKTPQESSNRKHLWDKKFGIGSLMAVMIPYSIWQMVTGVIIMIAWAGFNLPLGPGAFVEFNLTR